MIDGAVVGKWIQTAFTFFAENADDSNGQTLAQIDGQVSTAISGKRWTVGRVDRILAVDQGVRHQSV